jgi:exopolysaccharide biosynthesis predicted pyruvyltransferase EpsI
MNDNQEFSDLAHALGELRGTRFVFVPNPGNAGDSFIAHATYQFLDRLGLDYAVGEETETYPEQTIVYGSGGNLVTPYVNLNNFLIRNAPVCTQLIILPHTIRAYERTLRSLGENCSIYCRDAVSHDFVARTARKARVALSHDMAFAADFGETARQMNAMPWPFLSNRRFARRNIKRIAITGAYKVRAPRVLDAFRLDCEMTDRPIPTPNIDVSAVFATGDMSRLDALETTYRMMRFVDGFRTVNTNRLHVAIMGAMLGKTVNFYDNSYGKNSAVFQHSFEGRFENVHWRDSREGFVDRLPDSDADVA